MKSIFALAATVLMASTAQAAVTVYTDQAAYAAALGTSTTEGFEDTTLAPGLSFTSSVGSISGGVFNDRTVLGSADTTFSFSPGTHGFGAIFDETPGGFGQNLAFFIDGTNFVGELAGANPGTFYGFISDTAFTSVLITSGSGAGVAETYNLDNLQFSGTVPEPASWALMIGGFAMTGFAMRRRVALTA